jgi:hypothetical protein
LEMTEALIREETPRAGVMRSSRPPWSDGDTPLAEKENCWLKLAVDGRWDRQ